jgi:hypothetical protein
MSFYPHISRICAGLVLVAALAGCSESGPKIVKVTGTLKYKGQPVPNAYLTFRPEFGRQSWAQTDEQGRFKVNYDRTQDGAVVGKHKVSAEMWGGRPSTPAEQEAVMQGRRLPVSKDLTAFFQKYGADNSKLEVEITPDTKELNLDLD